MHLWLTALTVFASTVTIGSITASTINPGANTGASLLEQTSKAFTQIAKKAMPTTVFIKAEIQSEQNQFQQLDPFQDDFFRRFFGGENPFGLPQQPPQIQTASGSGFIVRPDGYIVTNNHVVKDATKITVLLNDGREFSATIKGTDPRTDLAVLKIEEKNLPYLEFGNSDEVQVGEWVIAIGNPFGLEASLTVGVVSAKGRQDLGIASFEDFIQTDAAINPGNSGGALLNLQSEVVGVNTAILSRSGGYMGIGLSIPSKMAQSVVDQIIDGGAVRRAYMGIVLQPVDKELANVAGLEKQEGILIAEVIKDSPAHKAGLQQGDIILSYNEKPAKNVAKFRNDIALMAPSTEIKLKIIRNHKPMHVSLALGLQAEDSVATAEIIQKLGLEIESITAEMAAKIGVPAGTEGVVITKVKPGSVAALAQLRPGCVITSAGVNWNNQKKIKNLAEFDEVMKDLGPAKTLILIVRHQNFQKYYTLKLN
jgi:serine protease Do